MFVTDRRLLLAALSASLVPTPFRAALAAGEAVRLGPPQPFSFDMLAGRAAKSASQPYRAPVPPAPELIAGIDFDAVQKIKFRPDHALWRGRAGQDPIAFFHLNRYSGDPVLLHTIEDGKARQILYGSDYFDYGSSGLDPRKLGNLGFSGFRVMDGQDAPTDWLAFQGASYFRSSGQDGQYGASARGIAVDTGGPQPEEFPRFTQFWLEPHAGGITIFALLDGPSVTGAYRFDAVKKHTVTIDVEARLFFRRDIARLGLAPLTSMYWYGENQRDKAADWRPEIHDNDGLALWTGAGERIWRPLINPPAVQTNSFLDTDPKGFGLIQRDRDFDHYQDDGAFYEKRPGIWIEPRGAWGKGEVQLVEIPTDDEIHDNIVAYWRPAETAKAHGSMHFAYRLYWQDSIPDYPAGIARVVATRLGRGGIPGAIPWPRDKTKFVVDFTGGPLASMAQRYDVEPVITASHGTVDGAYVIKVVGTPLWRALFDLQFTGTAPVDLRLYLRLNGKTLSETWLYQYFPPGP
ncbi:MAG: glucan biosynthesis protein D [Alphaproteobacteria bacterium 64-11]|nr:glucan biosynthesis protein [Alphaproteobacteria bacterium]OJU11447.1 MAG: glucan biosynthesis protein D [Alphaproteobacteria bacterium 64-11]